MKSNTKQVWENVRSRLAFVGAWTAILMVAGSAATDPAWAKGKKKGQPGPNPPKSEVVQTGEYPDCLDGSSPLTVDNPQTLEWKRSKPNQWQERARIHGTVVRITKERKSHAQFEIQIGPEKDDVVEVIYNVAFGKLPKIQTGMTVEACGDFIISRQKAGPYEASPSGAIIHWVHVNPHGKGHDSGYLIINGNLYGYSGEGASGKHSQDVDAEPLDTELEDIESIWGVAN